VLALLAALAAVGWWLTSRWATAARSPLVGTWRIESATPVFPARPELVVEFDLLADGSIRERGWDPRTGAVDYDQPVPGRWRVRDGRLQQVDLRGRSWQSRLLGGGGPERLVWDHGVTWEGPDRLRLDGATRSRKDMVWVRSEWPPVR
jgi:hypothetical protein